MVIGNCVFELHFPNKECDNELFLHILMGLYLLQKGLLASFAHFYLLERKSSPAGPLSKRLVCEGLDQAEVKFQVRYPMRCAGTLSAVSLCHPQYALAGS